MDPVDARAELEQLQKELSERKSTRCFADFAISLAAALLVAGAAAKLFWDSLRTPWLGFVAAAVALGLATWSIRRYRRGKAYLRTEVERFERMNGLKRSLGIDDPASLLPES